MVYMLLGTGFEETEAVAPLDLLRRAGIDVMTVGIHGKIVKGLPLSYLLLPLKGHEIMF